MFKYILQTLPFQQMELKIQIYFSIIPFERHAILKLNFFSFVKSLTHGFRFFFFAPTCANRKK